MRRLRDDNSVPIRIGACWRIKVTDRTIRHCSTVLCSRYKATDIGSVLWGYNRGPRRWSELIFVMIRRQLGRFV